MFLEILPAFLTPRTMFLLLFDASKDISKRWQSRQNAPDGEVLFGEVVNESTSNLMAKWMSTIHSHLVKHNKEVNPSPSLYCIGTRGDKLNEAKRKKINMQMKCLYNKREFSDIIQDVLIVDNTTSGKWREDPNIRKLREAIGVFLKSKLIVKTTPVNWVLFRKVLQELKQNVISKDDAIIIGGLSHIPAGDVPDVLIFYHELGALLYYPHIRGLENKVILSPKWFVETLGKVFRLKGEWSGSKKWSLLEEKGILVESLYHDVWENDDNIDPQGLIELLVCFRLAAPVETEFYDSRVKQYFLPAVLRGYTGQPNEAPPGYKLRASPAHITFSTGYVPPGFFTRLATTVATQFNLKPHFDKNIIYRNCIAFSYGHPHDDIILTDLHYAIQVDVLRYVPEGSHPVPFKTVCQNVLKLLDECCQQVEETLHGYHGQCIDQSSIARQVQYLCQCKRPKDIHYIVVTENQTCLDLIYCQIKRRPRPMTHNESMWFEGEVLYHKTAVLSIFGKITAPTSKLRIGMYWAILKTYIIIHLYP